MELQKIEFSQTATASTVSNSEEQAVISVLLLSFFCLIWVANGNQMRSRLCKNWNQKKIKHESWALQCLLAAIIAYGAPYFEYFEALSDLSLNAVAVLRATINCKKKNCSSVDPYFVFE